MVPDQGIPTSVLLQTLKERRCQVSYPTFIKWRQEDLIPDPLPDRPGRGRGSGRSEARWPPAVLEQVEQVCRLRQDRLRYNEIAIELWLSGFTIPTERLRKALLDEWKRFLDPFEARIYQLRQRLGSGDDDSARHAVERLARRIARRRPRYTSLPHREQKATVTAWRQLLALMVFGVDRADVTQDGQRLVSTVGFSPEFANEFVGFLQSPEEAQWVRGVVNETALAEALKDPDRSADLLVRALPQARFLRFIAELPESLTNEPADWSRTLRFMKLSQSMSPRAFGIGMLLMKMVRGGEDPGFSNVAAVVEAMAQEISRASPLLAAQLRSAAPEDHPVGCDRND